MIEYSYQVLRYMPDQVSGEFMNVGLVVYHSPSQDIAIKLMKNNGRIQQFYPSSDAASLIDYLANIERVFNQ